MLGLFVLLPVGACNCNDSSSDAVNKDSKTQPAEATQPDGEKPKADNAKKSYPDDIYPGFNFGVLNDDEKVRFVEVAKAELCPCPNSAESLHDCLQKTEKRCGMAQQASTIVAMGIKEGLSQTDVLDKIAEYLTAARKKYDFDLKIIPYKGNPDAKLVIVEFADFECPHCREMGVLMGKLAKKHGDKIAVYYKHFPLGGHTNAAFAARATVAAHKQEKFWPMHDVIFENQRSLSPEKILRFAQQLGLNETKFKADLESPEIAQVVAADKKAGEDAQLTGTPTIFFNGVRYLGDRTEEALDQAITDALAATTQDTK